MKSRKVARVRQTILLSEIFLLEIVGCSDCNSVVI
jgi:hypothetical protein